MPKSKLLKCAEAAQAVEIARARVFDLAQSEHFKTGGNSVIFAAVAKRVDGSKKLTFTYALNPETTEEMLLKTMQLIREDSGKFSTYFKNEIAKLCENG